MMVAASSVFPLSLLNKTEPMTDRIKQLREQSLNAVNALSAERAQLVTAFYKSEMAGQVSIPVMRAMALDFIFGNKTIFINPKELITGERGPSPKATPTYPEINLHSLEDLDILDKRQKVSFKVDEETRRIYRDEIIPFWKGKSNRERIMNAMEPEWLAAYNAGIFTEFQEQRAPGHTVCGDKIYRKGMLDILRDIELSKAQIDSANDPDAPEKEEELKAMSIAAGAVIRYAERHAVKLEEMANTETNPETRMEMFQLAGICRKVPAHAPETFHEALQYYWFVHLAVVTELLSCHGGISHAPSIRYSSLYASGTSRPSSLSRGWHRWCSFLRSRMVSLA